MVVFARLAVPLLTAVVAGGTQSRLQITEPDPLEELGRLIEVSRKSEEREEGLDSLLVESIRKLSAHLLRPCATEEAIARREGIALAFLDVVGLDLGRTLSQASIDVPAGSPASVAVQALRDAMASEPFLLDFLTRSVIVLPSAHPLARRSAAVRLVASKRDDSVRLALFTAASTAEPELQVEAIRALSGWNDSLVNRFLITRLPDLVERRDAAGERAVLEHFGRIEDLSSLDSASAALLRQHIFDSIASPDWRRAVQATELQRSLPLEIAGLGLVEGLEIWTERSRRGLASRRVLGGILAELELRSGHKLGLNPERWRAWWQSALQGRAQSSPDNAEQATQASFFGLRPWTDRVVFIIDQSGSMADPFGTRRSSRYSEAVRQMLALLRSMGESTLFRVVLFNSSTKAWNVKMRPATEKNLNRVEEWLDAKHPHGGTALRPAIEAAMEIQRDGSLRLEELEADTVIVLCDGETEEGRQWVAPFLARYNTEAALVFHCVSIGSQGDGSLAELAEGSGGQLVFAR